MDIVRPNSVVDATLVYSNVPETPPSAWSSVTTYAVNAQVSVAGANNRRDVYRSLASGNLNHNPVTASIWWEFLGATYGVWAAGTTYVIGDVVLFNSGGYHELYENVITSNTGNNPTLPANTDKWLDIGRSNRWKVFDGAVNSQTEAPEVVSFTVNSTERTDTLVLLNLDAAAVRVRLEDATAGVVFDETYSLVSSSGITDWYSYFYEPVERTDFLLVQNLPRYANIDIIIDVLAPDGVAKIGAFVFGLAKNFGFTQYGASVSLQDYSVKERNSYGDFNIVERSYSKRANFSVFMDNSFVDQAQVLLARYRATPIVYIGSSRFGATVVYGFYRDFSITIPYPDNSVCNIEIEGLT